MAKCTVYKRCCAEHDFVHGAEAEELRKGIEDLLSQYDEKKIPRSELQRLLDRVDARDSLAFLEAQEAGCKTEAA